jgi:tetratricopeptide (TPR) repeat protein
MHPIRRDLATYRSSLLLALAVAFLILATPVSAQLPGSVYGLIMDEKGEPVPGVVITITDPERPDFKQVEESDKRGRFRIRLANATIPYEFLLEKDGYQTVTMGGVKIPARTDTRRNFDMKSNDAAMAESETEAAAAGKGAVATFNQGVSALQAGDPDTAIELFTAALEQNPELGVAHSALARVYLDEKQHQQAIEHAEQAVAMSADADAMQQVLYAAYTATGEATKAAAALEKLKTASPERASQNLYNQAADAYNKGDMPTAKAGFEQVVLLDPKNAQAHYMLGLVFVSEGANDKAKEHLGHYLELAPDDPDAATARDILKYLE